MKKFIHTQKSLTALFLCIFAAVMLTFTGWACAEDAAAEPDDAAVFEGFEGFEDAEIPQLEEAEAPETRADKPATSGSFVLPGFTRKTDDAETLPAAEPEISRATLEEVIPAHALMIARSAPLDTLNQRGRYFFAQLGLGAAGPLDWIRLSAYGKAAAQVDMKGQAAVVYVPYGNLMVSVVILPVRDYRNFVLALGANPETLPDPLLEGYVSVVKLPAGYHVFQKKGYAFVVEPAPRDVLLGLWKAEAYAETYALTPCAMENSHISLELTENGIQHLLALGKIALSDFAPVFSEAMKSLEIPDPELEMAEEYYDRADIAIQWMEQNLAGVRLDVNIHKDTLLTSVTLQPQPDSPLMAQVRDTTGPLVCTTLDMDYFLKIVPDFPSPVAGQADITADVAAKLDAPFHRVRHVEFSLAPPDPDELLAEHWCFFLEVDDAQAFVTELILPKAQMIGGYIGSSALGDMGARIGENLASTRAARQSRRFASNRPVRGRLADPQAAAQRGGEIGAKIGNLIGRAAGEKEGMKVYDFDGYPLYVSDLVVYAREMKKMRAEQAGDYAHRGLDGDWRLINVIQRGVVGLQTGDLQNGFADILGQFMTREATGGPDPLIARQNLVLILDDKHILIVPGNEEMLRAAKDNWETVRDLYLNMLNQEALPPTPADFSILRPAPETQPTGGKIIPAAFETPAAETTRRVEWYDSWDAIREEVVNPEINIVRTTVRADWVQLQFLGDVIRESYAPALPQLFSSRLPEDTPPALAVSTVTDEHVNIFFSTPHELAKNFLQIYLKKMTEEE